MTDLNSRVQTRTLLYPYPPDFHLHTFRYCKALREFHKTGNTLHVMDILGHKKIDTTYHYIRIYNQIYKPKQPHQYITKIGSTNEERIELINDGWELINQDEEEWYFRKPKLE